MSAALDMLERVAGRMKWKLRWVSEPLLEHPALTITRLDIANAGGVLPQFGWAWCQHFTRSGTRGARQRIAERVLDSLPSRGAGHV